MPLGLSPMGTLRAPSTSRRHLKTPCPFHGGHAKHLLKGCATIRGYICGTLGQQGKAQKQAPMASEPVDAASEDDTEFPEADRCLLIFGGS